MSIMGWFKGGIVGVMTLIVLILWSFGGFIGAVIQASRHDMVGVVLSIFVPGYGAVVTVLAIFGIHI